MEGIDSWQRRLWIRQPFPDNYVPASFLDSLLRNSNVQPYNYWSITLHACAISQQISAISIFSSTFILLFQQRLDPRSLALISLAAFLAGFFIWEAAFSHSDAALARTLRNKALKSSILVLLILMVLAPVLRTLTATTSSDSIWPLAAILFALNALLTDYVGLKRRTSSSERLTSVLSINAALSASVVLASRLPNPSSVFSLILLSVLVFGQIPMLRSRTPRSRPKLKILATIGVAIMTVALALLISKLHAIFSGIVLLFITFAIPQILMWAQGFKNEIRGPWDVASPVVISIHKSKA